MSNVINIITTDSHKIEIDKKYCIESKLLMNIFEMDNDSNEINLNIDNINFNKIYEYMKYSYNNIPNINLIEKPTIKSVSNYLSDVWYDKYFNNITDIITFYNNIDYLFMTNLSSLFVAYIANKLNNLENKENIDQILNLNRNEKNDFKSKQIYNIENNTFEYMKIDEIPDYLNRQRKNWS